MGRIKVVGSAIMKEEQLDIARLLVKAGYTVNIEKAKSAESRSVVYINYSDGKGEPDA